MPDRRERDHATRGEAKLDGVRGDFRGIKQVPDAAESASDKIINHLFEVTTGKLDFEMLFRATRGEDFRHKNMRRLALGEGDFRVLASLDQPRLRSRLEARPIHGGMLLLVALFYEADEAEIEAVAAHFRVSEIEHLHERASAEFAKREVERAAAPIEDERESALELRDVLLVVGSSAQVAVERRERLVNKLHNAQSGESEGIS